jgi:hypothetical protein
VSASAIDFSDLGAKPVGAPPSGIDFSDIGGKAVSAQQLPVARPSVSMEPSAMSPIEQAGAEIVDKATSLGSHLVDAGKQIANDTYDVSTPNIATQLYRKLQGKNNSLDKIPGKAIAAFFTAAGLPEEELATEVAAASKATPAAAEQAVEDQAADHIPVPGAGIPRTLSGESALRQILGGQDSDNLLKIAKSRGINVVQESQLKPSAAIPKLMNKIIDDFSDNELEELRSTYAEQTRMGRHNFGDIGPEANKTMSLQTYFPDVKIPSSVLKRTQAAIAKSAPAAVTKSTGTAAQSAGDDLTGILQESLKRAQRAKTTALP